MSLDNEWMHQKHKHSPDGYVIMMGCNKMEEEVHRGGKETDVQTNKDTF